MAQPSVEQQDALSRAPVRADGTVRNLFLTLAHHPKLLARFNAFAGTFFIHSRLTDGERELIILRVATRARCVYELAQHLEIARDVGLDEPTILAAIGQLGAGVLDARGQLLMSVTDAVCRSGAVADSDWQQLAADGDEAQLLEIIAIIGFYRMAADLMNIVGIATEEPIEVPSDWGDA